MIGGSRRAALGWLVGLVAVWSSPGAAQPYFYPMQGQSPQQEESDKGQCYAWAVEQTGFVKGMKMSDLASEKPRESAIRNVGHANGKVILSGAEGERGWILLINETSGTMSATAAGDGEGFVLFG
jgi:hypothetical protein